MSIITKKTSGNTGFLAVMVLSAVCSALGVWGVADTYADGSSISLTVSNDTLSFDLLPTSVGGTFAKSDNINVGVALSGVGGYTLSVRAGNTSNPTALISGGNTIPSLSTAVSESTFNTSTDYNNKWGYKPSKLNSSDNTNYLPSPSLEGDILDKTSGTNDEGSYTISLGARVDMDTAPGNYSNTFVIAAIANSTCNPSATGILEAVCMQDMNDSVANSMAVNKQYELVDNRDNKVYYVAKMKDNRVWMTQNLDLDLETTPTNVARLNENNTDINSSTGIYSDYTTVDGALTWTPERATSATWGSDYNNPYSYDNGTKYYYTDTNGTSTTYDTKATCEADHADGTCAHYHSGNYYNFSAAVASNDTSGITSGVAANSICPKGWRLPNVSSGYGDMNQTWLAEGITTGIVTAVEHYGNYATDGYKKISNAPLYLVRSGYRDNGNAPQRTGSYGYFRTGQVNDATYAWTYYFTPIYPYPYERYATTNWIWFTRAYQTPVRCVARQSNTGGSTVITFNKNAPDATGTMSNKTIAAGSSSALTSNAFTRSEYVFNGWNTASDGSGTQYNDAATYYAAVGTITTNVTLYAQWTPAHTLTVNAGSNVKVSTDGGTNWTTAGGSATMTVGEGQTIVLKAKDDTSGTVFNNWTKNSGAGDFTSTPWRSANTKTTSFVVGAGDATVTANSTTTYTTIDAGSTTEMQNITACPDWLTTGTMYQVTDNRDSEVYNVAKLADGKCWLLDNLRLGSATTTTALTPANTNIASNYTLVAGDNWSNTATAPKINASYKNDIAPTKYGNASGKVGTYYNYCAASAGEVCTAGDDAVNTTHDICPAGWRMPTGGYEDKKTGFGEYYSLYYAYNSNQANYKAALSVPLSGYFYSSSQDDLGSRGYFWSSTFHGGFYSYVLNANSSGVSPADYNSRNGGFSVRCVLSE